MLYYSGHRCDLCGRTAKEVPGKFLFISFGEESDGTKRPEKKICRECQLVIKYMVEHPSAKIVEIEAADIMPTLKQENLRDADRKGET